MDLPRLLEKMDFVSGQDELHQCMYLLLVEEIGEFCQDFTFGSKISAHVSSANMVDYHIRAALKPLMEVQIEKIDLSKFPTVDLIYTYRGVVSYFRFVTPNNEGITVLNE